MRSIELIAYSMKSIRAKTRRTLLTIAAISIGICMLVILFGLVTGMKESIIQKFEKFGSRAIMITPIDIKSSNMMLSLMPTKGKLFDRDYNRLKKIEGIDKIMEVYFGRVGAEYKGDKIGIRIIGVDPKVAWGMVQEIEIQEGRLLDDKDIYSAVIGSEVAKNGFKSKVMVGSIITLGNKSFRIVGILKPVGNEVLQIDNSIFVPGKAAKEILSYQLMENEISGIRILAKENVNVNKLAEEIENTLLLSHHVPKDEKDFTVITQKKISERIDSVIGIVEVFGGIISAIALIIGSIGTANTIYMGVIERTREIGTLRAIGMQKNDVVNLFLVEAGILTTIGGIMGVFAGISFLLIISTVLGITTRINIGIGIIGIVASILVGLVSGYIPARKGGKLSPTVALRYE